MKSIDFAKILRVQQAAIALYESSKGVVEYDENNILDVINNAIAFLRLELNEDEYERLKKNVMMQCQIRHSYDGAMITDDYFNQKWYTNLENKSGYFWERYKRYLISEKHFGLNIVNKLEQETLTDLMDFLGDPNSPNDFIRRGLIIGDVQSGKTSTYIGLICKAADAGYKVVILLTGTTESLRKQTQERIEEGFVGADIAQLESGVNNAFRVGVGKDGQPIKVTVLTSRENDFVGQTDKILTSIESNKVVLLVVKKNTTVLTKLVNWLIKINGDPVDKKIHYPMLLIDDEADNASINTKKEEENPTAVNSAIRKLVDVFTKSNYVGFTATPYANIFINPFTTSDMENEDLFPKNFIYCLPTPSNYIGAKQIFCKDGDYKNSLVYIKDIPEEDKQDGVFCCAHKKEWTGDFPKSLKESLYCFLLANAIRDLRGDITAHRSMLINISRFIKVQHLIKEHIEQLYNKIMREIKFNLTSELDSIKDNNELKLLYQVWETHYSNLEFSWEEIVKSLYNSCENILIKVVNSSKNSEKINYDQHKQDGLRLIAIGGLALSRGLTLEGLIISYFYRNTSTYDVLMQMGRWFGYRNNYEDLFRIWIGERSSIWYSEISEATEELKLDIARMNELKKTPKDFGIRVRNDCKELGITSNVKMRTATDRVIYERYFGNLVQAPYICNDIEVNNNNLASIENLINQVGINNIKEFGKKKLFLNVSKNLIVEFFSKIKTSEFNARFNAKDIYDFLISYNDDILNSWDVAFIPGESKKEPFKIAGLEIQMTKRDGEISEKKVSVSKKGQLTGPADAIAGLEDSKKMQAEEKFKQNYRETKGEDFTEDKTFPAKAYFEYVQKRNPLLLIYFIDVNISNDPLIFEKFGNKPLVSFGMGVPVSEFNETKVSKYKVNRIYKEEEEE